MRAGARIARWRRQEEARFTSAVRVERPADGTFDPATGTVSPAVPTVIYDGPGLVRTFTWEGTDVTTGDREVRFRGARLKLPHDTPIQKDDEVVVTASKYDSGLVGRRFRVTDVHRDEWQITRLSILEEIT